MRDGIDRLDFGTGRPEERRIAMLRRGMYKPLATATNQMLVYILRLNGHVQPKVVIKDTVNWRA